MTNNEKRRRLVPGGALEESSKLAATKIFVLDTSPDQISQRKSTGDDRAMTIRARLIRELILTMRAAECRCVDPLSAVRRASPTVPESILVLIHGIYLDKVGDDDFVPTIGYACS
jgi:hypothetical protein